MLVLVWRGAMDIPVHEYYAIEGEAMLSERKSKI